MISVERDFRCNESCKHERAMWFWLYAHLHLETLFTYLFTYLLTYLLRYCLVCTGARLPGLVFSNWLAAWRTLLYKPTSTFEVTPIVSSNSQHFSCVELVTTFSMHIICSLWEANFFHYEIVYRCIIIQVPQILCFLSLPNGVFKDHNSLIPQESTVYDLKSRELGHSSHVLTFNIQY
jgi:hypothetical protein